MEARSPEPGDVAGAGQMMPAPAISTTPSEPTTIIARAVPAVGVKAGLVHDIGQRG
jgi:hypothetical protein